ncbi:MAG: triose-phosphate isomerase [Anaerolineales bacterium]|nr:triose-phosphate isomerase [Anaerolineales bacterium]
MRTALIAGNWKMHLTEKQAVTLTRKLLWVQNQMPVRGVEVLLCPPFTALSQLHKLLVGSTIKLGAQNMSAEVEGAFTGEISPLMLAEFCSYVIVGHSERRAIFGETDALINRKVKNAITHSLIPILCVGETLAEKESGKAHQVVYAQMIEGLKEVPIFSANQLVVAYEPVWAIGTGWTATPQESNALIAATIRPALVRLFGEQVANGVSVLYGGSVKPDNARGFFQQPEIDGALVGGASLDADSFRGIIEAARNCS